jgi:glycosyltransferase involved in cell wall biosynthesis
LISGFSFVHNAIDSGYPIVESVRAVQPYVDEVVVVDMESTDDTRHTLDELGCGIIEGVWDCKAGRTLAKAYSLNSECSGDIIIHFEADEVYSDSLIKSIKEMIQQRFENISVLRLQVEQNFQRIRWYPVFVHRVFPKGSTKKIGHTTNLANHHKMLYLKNRGYLWDITNCFRDNWMNRVKKQAELRGDITLNYLMVGEHCNFQVSLTYEQAMLELEQSRWIWTETPLAIPKILKPLVGMTKYEPKL